MQNESVTIEFPTSFRLRKKVLKSPEELISWVQSEKIALKEFYIEMNNGPLWRDTGGRGMGWRTRRILDQLQGQAQEWRNSINQQRDISQLMGQLNGQVSYYSKGDAIPSTAPFFGEFRKYWEGNTDADRLGFMCARLGQPVIDAGGHLAGYIQGTLVETKTLPFAEGDLERVRNGAAACEETLAALAAKLDEQNQLATSSKEEWETLSQSYKEAADAELTARKTETEEFAQSHRDTMGELVENIASRIQTCDTELGDFRKRIETEISLGEPIKYWQRREASHNRAFWVSLVAFIVVAGGFVATLSFQGRKLMDEIERHQLAISKEARLAMLPAVSTAPTAATPTAATPTAATPTSGNDAGSESPASVAPYHFVRLGILALGSTMAIWFLRFIARIILSSLHLRDDAAERVAMIKTFLALNESKVGLEPEDVRMALASVFRPATSGLVKDDGVPPGVWDAITRIKG